MSLYEALPIWSRPVTLYVCAAPKLRQFEPGPARADRDDQCGARNKRSKSSMSAGRGFDHEMTIAAAFPKFVCDRLADDVAIASEPFEGLLQGLIRGKPVPQNVAGRVPDVARHFDAECRIGSGGDGDFPEARGIDERAKHRRSIEGFEIEARFCEQCAACAVDLQSRCKTTGSDDDRPPSTAKA